MRAAHAHLPQDIQLPQQLVFFQLAIPCPERRGTIFAGRMTEQLIRQLRSLILWVQNMLFTSLHDLLYSACMPGLMRPFHANLSIIPTFGYSHFSRWKTSLKSKDFSTKRYASDNVGPQELEPMPSCA